MELIKNERRDLIKFLAHIWIRLANIVAKLFPLADGANIVQQHGINSLNTVILPEYTHFLFLIVVVFLDVANRVEVTVIAHFSNCVAQSGYFLLVVYNVLVHSYSVGFLHWIQSALGHVRSEHQDADFGRLHFLGLQVNGVPKADDSFSDVGAVFDFDISSEQILNALVIWVSYGVVVLINNESNIIDASPFQQLLASFQNKSLKCTYGSLVHGRSDFKHKHHECLHHEQLLRLFGYIDVGAYRQFVIEWDYLQSRINLSLHFTNLIMANLIILINKRVFWTPNPRSFLLYCPCFIEIGQCWFLIALFYYRLYCKKLKI